MLFFIFSILYNYYLVFFLSLWNEYFISLSKYCVCLKEGHKIVIDF